jgi:homoserine acetyltransferase
MQALDPIEYQRRHDFNEYMKTMDKNAFIEVARILKKHDVAVSENRSGIFFDLAKIPQTAFDDLIRFREFVEKNTTELEKPRSVKH